MKKNKFVVAGVVTAALVAGAGITYAAIPAADGTIHGCYSSGALGTGALFVIDDAATCPSGYTALNWDQTAPSGLQGYEVVTDSFVINGPDSAGTDTFTVNCPTGKVALGAGFKGDHVSSQVLTDGSGWEFDVQHPSVGSGGQYNSSGRITCATDG